MTASAGSPMPPKKPVAREHVHYHKDGSIWARGPVVDGVMSGYWEWYRKDGTRMRSGHFERGEQSGEWTTYDKAGAVYKVTVMKPKAAPVATSTRATKKTPASTQRPKPKPKPTPKPAPKKPAARRKPRAR